MYNPGVRLLASALLLLSSSLLVAPCRASPVSRRQSSSPTTCNGHAELCQRLYSNVTFAGSHDSAFIGKGTTTVSANQDIPIASQLDAGARILQVQAHESGNSSATGAGIDLCHTSCSLFQGGALEYWLQQIKSWSDANPNEVITLLLVNADNLPASKFGQAFQSTGLSGKMYKPSQASLTLQQWPTLQSLISSGTPIVGFLASGADTQSVPYLLPQFTNMWEDPYDQTSTPFNCSLDRIDASLASTGSSNIMYLHNHFLDSSVLGGAIMTPNVKQLNTTNAEATVLSQAYSCASQHDNRNPNFLLADYLTEGGNGVVMAAARLNGVPVTSKEASFQKSVAGSSAAGGSSTSGARAKAAAAASSRVALAVALASVAAGLAMAL